MMRARSSRRLAWLAAIGVVVSALTVPGGASSAQSQSALELTGAHQPLGLYAIHIVVRGRRTTLFGLVDSDADRQVAGMRARGVPGVVSVANELAIASDERRAAR